MSRSTSGRTSSGSASAAQRRSPSIGNPTVIAGDRSLVSLAAHELAHS
jgi:hypothetical protein